MTKWVHVKTKTPSTQRLILVYSLQTDDMNTGFYNLQNKEFYKNGVQNVKIPHVTHWSEAPFAPKMTR